MRNHLKIIAIVFALLIISMPVCFAIEITPTYDANGNMQYDGDTYTEYNSMNQPVRVYNGSNSSGTLLQEYTYDSEEERVLIKHDYVKNETTYYFDKEYVRVKNASGTYDFEYVYLEGQLIAQVNPDGSKIYIHSDHIGSATVITNQSGAVIENTSYSPSGEVLQGGTKTRFGYEAKEHDTVVGDTDFNFRKYKAEWQLLKKPDTEIRPYDPQSLNRYMFEKGNPYRYTDPTGHIEEETDNFPQRVLAVYIWGKIQKWNALEDSLREKYDTNEIPKTCYGCKPYSHPTFRELQERELRENFDVLLDEEGNIKNYLYKGKTLEPSYKEMTNQGFYRSVVKKAVQEKIKQKESKPSFKADDLSHAGEVGSNYAKITRRNGNVEYQKIR